MIENENSFNCRSRRRGDPGAVGCGYEEATETRRIVQNVAQHLRTYGVDVALYGKYRNAYTDLCNGVALPLGVDYVVEVHLNAGVGDQGGNGYTTGTEILVHPSEAGVTVEQEILSRICDLGFTNRGIKPRSDLGVMGYYVANGISHALIETCFIDDLDDMRLYEANFDAICEAIADGIVAGFGLEGGSEVEENKNQEPSKWAAESWNKAHEMGLLDGTRPHDAVTREELAAVLVRLSEK